MSANPGDLTTVANVQLYLGIPTTQDSVLLQRLVTAASSYITRFLSRTLPATTYTNELYNGANTNRIMLRNYPIISVSAVSMNDTAIQASANTNTPGWINDEFLVYYRSGIFWCGIQNVSVTYVAGYPNLAITDPPIAIPASPYQLRTVQTDWVVDVSVKYFVGGAPLVRVFSSPAIGQYFVDSTGLYTFAAADVTSPVIISYQVLGIPAAITQLANQLVAIGYKRRTNIDIKSETLATQTIVYQDTDLTRGMREVLSLFNSVAPV